VDFWRLDNWILWLLPDEKDCFFQEMLDWRRRRRRRRWLKDSKSNFLYIIAKKIDSEDWKLWVWPVVSQDWRNLQDSDTSKLHAMELSLLEFKYRTLYFTSKDPWRLTKLLITFTEDYQRYRSACEDHMKISIQDRIYFRLQIGYWKFSKTSR